MRYTGSSRGSIADRRWSGEGSDQVDERAQAILAELRRAFEGLYGDRLVQMVLFGSHARDDAEPESDIDVLVVLKDPVDVAEEIPRTGELVSALSLDHNAVVSCVFMGEGRFLHRNGPLLRNVRKEGVPV
jgi:predicted nucleotidyltransferase